MCLIKALLLKGKTAAERFGLRSLGSVKRKARNDVKRSETVRRTSFGGIGREAKGGLK